MKAGEVLQRTDEVLLKTGRILGSSVLSSADDQIPQSRPEVVVFAAPGGSKTL